MSAKSKPTVNTEAMEFFQFFDYAKPDLSTPKGLVKLVQSDILRGMVQILSPGQRNNLHSHAAEDGFYFVLKGRVRFYGPDHILAGEFGPHQGLLIPAARVIGLKISAKTAKNSRCCTLVPSSREKKPPG